MAIHMPPLIDLEPVPPSTEERTREWRCPSRAARWLAFVGFLAVAQLAGLIGVPFTDRATDGWYDQLDKPPFNPPSAVFAPVWTTLYVLMAIAVWRVWMHCESRDRTLGLRLWGVQLALNALWTPLFFGAQMPALALAEVVLLVIAVATTAVVFARVDATAAAFLLPYLAWVSFATVLNASIVVLN